MFVFLLGRHPNKTPAMHLIQIQQLFLIQYSLAEKRRVLWSNMFIPESSAQHRQHSGDQAEKYHGQTGSFPRLVQCV